MFQTKVVVIIKTQILCSVTFFFYFFRKSCLHEKPWKNIVEGGRPHMAIRRMRIACRIANATNTHSEYVKRIAFPLQEWLHERASL